MKFTKEDAQALRVWWARADATLHAERTDEAPASNEQRKADLVGAVISAAQNMRNTFRQHWGADHNLEDAALDAISRADERLAGALSELETEFPPDRVDPSTAVAAALAGASVGFSGLGLTSTEVHGLTTAALDAVPDGWAKIGGEWVRVQKKWVPKVQKIQADGSFIDTRPVDQIERER